MRRDFFVLAARREMFVKMSRGWIGIAGLIPRSDARKPSTRCPKAATGSMVPPSLRRIPTRSQEAIFALFKSHVSIPTTP